MPLQIRQGTDPKGTFRYYHHYSYLLTYIRSSEYAVRFCANIRERSSLISQWRASKTAGVQRHAVRCGALLRLLAIIRIVPLPHTIRYCPLHLTSALRGRCFWCLMLCRSIAFPQSRHYTLFGATTQLQVASRL